MGGVILPTDPWGFPVKSAQAYVETPEELDQNRNRMRFGTDCLLCGQDVRDLSASQVFHWTRTHVPNFRGGGGAEFDVTVVSVDPSTGREVRRRTFGATIDENRQARTEPVVILPGREVSVREAVRRFRSCGMYDLVSKGEVPWWVPLDTCGGRLGWPSYPMADFLIGSDPDSAIIMLLREVPEPERSVLWAAAQHLIRLGSLGACLRDRMQLRAAVGQPLVSSLDPLLLDALRALRAGVLFLPGPMVPGSLAAMRSTWSPNGQVLPEQHVPAVVRFRSPAFRRFVDVTGGIFS